MKKILIVVTVMLLANLIILGLFAACDGNTAKASTNFGGWRRVSTISDVKTIDDVRPDGHTVVIYKYGGYNVSAFHDKELCKKCKK